MINEANLSGSYGEKVEKVLESSIFSTVGEKVIKSYLMTNLKQSGDNYCIPTVEILADMDTNVKQALLDLYEKNFCFADTSAVDEDIKILQACCLNGMVFGVNHDKNDALALYTSNIDLIFGVNKESKFDLGKSIELNENRIVNAVRLDILSDVADNVKFKVVGLNKNTNLQVVDPSNGFGRFHIIPFEYISMSLELIKMFLDNKYVIDVHQYTGEVEKARVITTKLDVLERYCDSEEFVWGLKPTFNPFRAFFYAPVVGANSFTAGVTRVDLMNLTRLSRLEKLPKTLKKAQPLDFIVEKGLLGWLEDLRITDASKYQDIVDSFPNKKGIITGSVNNLKDGVISTSSIAHYWHGCSEADRLQVIKEHKEISVYAEKYSKLFVDNKPIDIHTLDAGMLKEMLKVNTVKVIIKKEDGMYSNMVVTNNKETLKSIYGEDYFAKKESFGVRLWELQNRIDADRSMPSVIKALDYCGFPDTDEVINSIREVFVDGSNIHEGLAEVLKDDVNTRTNRSPELSETTIKARSVLSTLYGGPHDYYKNVDLSKVVSASIMG